MKGTLRYLFIGLMALTGLNNSFAQDKLFTQAFAHPVDLNPAFAGAIDGRYRVSIGYRDQWRSQLESQFTTMGVYGDIKIIRERKSDYFGAAFSIVSDRTALYNVNQNALNLFGSYHKAINPSQRQYLSAGLGLGIVQRSMNYEEIFFNDQFNGLDEYSLSTNEILPSNNFAFMDLGLGVAFRSAISEYSDLSVGFSVDHIPGSSISFYDHSIDQDIEYPESNIYRKFTGFISTQLASNEFVAFLPRLLFQVQGPHQMLAATALVRFDLTDYDEQALHLGGGIRLNQGVESGFKPTAYYLMAAYEVNGFQVGLSHDINATSLGAQAPGRGAFELSISFTGLYENEDTMCPSF